jgi:hypothetical protein
MPEVRRYLSLPVMRRGAALAASYWFGSGADNEPRFSLILRLGEKSAQRLLTLEEVDELRAACSRFLSDVDTRRAATGETCTSKADCRCTKCSPLSEL